MMAIAESIEVPQRSLNGQKGAGCCWWKERHAAFIALLVVVNVAIDSLALRLEEVGTGPLFVALGSLLAQVSLMGLWLAFGGLWLPLRFLIVAAVTVGGDFSTTMGIDDERLEVFRLLALMSGTIVLASHAILLSLRSLLGWRIDFDPAYHAIQTNRRMQLRLIDGLGFLTASALPFALLRFLGDDERSLTAVLGVVAFFASLPIALLVTAMHRSRQAWILAAVTWAAVLAVEYVTLAEFFHSGPEILLPFNLGLVATVLFNLGSLRYAFGLHLFSVIPSTTRAGKPPTTAAPLDPDLALLVVAWAELPESVRTEIITMARSHVTVVANKNATTA